MMVKAGSGRFALIWYLLFLAIAALSGGTSLYYSPSQPVIRLAAIGLIGALCLGTSDRKTHGYRLGFWFLGAIGLVILLQLIPLPPALWSSLPGRGRYLDAAIAAGEPQPWRPVNLTPDRGWNALFALLPPAAILFAAGRLRMRDQPIVLTALLIVVVASAVVGLAQVSAGGDDMFRLYAAPPTGSAVGLLANRNHQALLIACGLPMLAVWAAQNDVDRAKKRLRGGLALACGALLVLTIPTTGSRAGLALAGLALLFTIIFGWRAIGKMVGALSRPRRKFAIGAGLAAFAALIVGALTFGRAEAVHRLFETDPVDDARVQLLRPLIGMIGNFWPVGSGFGSFDPVYRGYEPFDDLALTIMNQAHDDYLQVVMEAGLPGLLLLIAFIGWWAWTSWRLWRRPGDEGATLGRLGSALILLMMLASIVDYPVRMPLIMVIAAQGAAWMLAPQSRRRESGTPAKQ